MTKIAKIIVGISIFVATLISLFVCYYSYKFISSRLIQKQNLKNISVQAVDYYNKKYNTIVTTKNTYYEKASCSSDICVGTTKNIFIRLSDGYIVYYNDMESKFYDNRQYKKLDQDLNDYDRKLLNAIVNDLKTDLSYISDDYGVFVSLFSTGLKEHSNVYYNGNLENFVLNEGIIGEAEIEVFCDKDSNWQELIEKYVDKYKNYQYFRISFIIFDSAAVNEGKSVLLGKYYWFNTQKQEN